LPLHVLLTNRRLYSASNVTSDHVISRQNAVTANHHSLLSAATVDSRHAAWVKGFHPPTLYVLYRSVSLPVGMTTDCVVGKQWSSVEQTNPRQKQGLDVSSSSTDDGNRSVDQGLLALLSLSNQLLISTHVISLKLHSCTAAAGGGRECTRSQRSKACL